MISMVTRPSNPKTISFSPIKYRKAFFLLLDKGSAEGITNLI
jgi:hypothetical protein